MTTKLDMLPMDVLNIVAKHYDDALRLEWWTSLPETAGTVHEWEPEPIWHGGTGSGVVDDATSRSI